jgi:hypothetical protein
MPYLPWAFVISYMAAASADVKLSLNFGWDRDALDRRWYTGLSPHITKDAHVREAILVSALTLLFAPFLSACPFNMYPGAKRVSDARHTGRAIACATPDAYEKVIAYYKKDCKVRE